MSLASRRLNLVLRCVFWYLWIMNCYVTYFFMLWLSVYTIDLNICPTIVSSWQKYRHKSLELRQIISEGRIYNRQEISYLKTIKKDYLTQLIDYTFKKNNMWMYICPNLFHLKTCGLHVSATYNGGILSILPPQFA